MVTLRDVGIGNVLKLTRHGGKWTVEKKRSPARPLRGYIALRSAKGSLKVIGSENWDIPVYKIIQKA